MFNEPRDNQRSKVYKWERKTMKRDPHMTLDECHKLALKMGKHYGLSGIRIDDGRGRRSPVYMSSGVIKLPKFARTDVVVAHEVAHWVVDNTVGHSYAAGHGPEFVGVFMYLLKKYCGKCPKELARSANEYRLDFKPIEAVKPNAIGSLR